MHIPRSYPRPTELCQGLLGSLVVGESLRNPGLGHLAKVEISGDHFEFEVKLLGTTVMTAVTA